MTKYGEQLEEEKQFNRMGMLMFPGIWAETVKSIQDILIKKKVNVYSEHPELAAEVTYKVLSAVALFFRNRNVDLRKVLDKK